MFKCVSFTVSRGKNLSTDDHKSYFQKLFTLKLNYISFLPNLFLKRNDVMLIICIVLVQIVKAYHTPLIYNSNIYPILEILAFTNYTPYYYETISNPLMVKINLIDFLRYDIISHIILAFRD